MRIRMLLSTCAIIGAVTICAGAAQGGKGGKGPGVQPPTAELSAEEEMYVLHMREEEKLARDVYLEFAETYSCAIFANIATAEQRHMDAVGLLIAKYDLTDPIVSDDRGVFATPAFGELYDAFLLAGAGSLLDALDVGAQIEELDIADLEDALDATTKTDIQWVFANLLRASNNHLLAFTRDIVAGGTTCAFQGAGNQANKTTGQVEDLASRGGKGRGKGNGTRGGSGQCDRQRRRDGSCLPAPSA
ncbi:MAG: DUF2202 domain-containing protein [Phycisphaerales bacterium]